MKRRLLNAGAFLSLILGVLILLLWAQSYVRPIAGSGGVVDLGSLGIQYGSVQGVGNVHWVTGRDAGFMLEVWPVHCSDWPQGWRPVRVQPVQAFGFGKWQYEVRGFSFVFWLPAVVFAVWPLVWAVGFVRRTAGTKGGCPACGYDLRGTPGSECPECGAEREVTT